jgi:hypothetical protein
MTAPPQPPTGGVVEVVVEAVRPPAAEAGVAAVVVVDSALDGRAALVGGAGDAAGDGVGTVDPIGNWVVRAVTIAAANGERVDWEAAEWLPEGLAQAARMQAAATQASQVKRGIAL